MHAWPDGYKARPFRVKDVENLAQLFVGYAASHGRRERVTAEQLRTQLTTPGFDPASSTWLVFDSDKNLVAVGAVFDEVSPHVRIHGTCAVAPEHQGIGLGTAIHERMLARACGAISKAPADARVFLQQSVADQDHAAIAFLESQRYTRTRHFWKMTAHLDQRIPSPVWPDGFSLTTLQSGGTIDELVEAVSDAFRDHYGYIEEAPHEKAKRLRHAMKNSPSFDPSAQFILRENDEIAAICLCSSQYGSDTDTGYVNLVGVRPAWRRRGLGLGLLHQAFRAFQDRGRSCVSLHVDAASLTGATQLYEKAGMHTEDLSHEYQRTLRPGD